MRILHVISSLAARDGRTPRTPLPGAGRERTKTGFATPMREWLGGEHGAPNRISLR